MNVGNDRKYCQRRDDHGLDQSRNIVIDFEIQSGCRIKRII